MSSQTTPSSSRATRAEAAHSVLLDEPGHPSVRGKPQHALTSKTIGAHRVHQPFELKERVLHSDWPTRHREPSALHALERNRVSTVART